MHLESHPIPPRPKTADDRLKIMVAKARYSQLKAELAMHRIAEADVLGFEQTVYRDWQTCEDHRAKMGYAKIIADIRRLGMREKAADTNQTINQVNILMDRERAIEITKRLAGAPLILDDRLRAKLGMPLVDDGVEDDDSSIVVGGEGGGV